ncbi:hypothetical protein [Sporosarcina sp. FA9]|uniref:hypothetical protein n=1 Tax=Sporosarcina sp. FA9 TaxID=3413030 RepID=UPI003F65F5BB
MKFIETIDKYLTSEDEIIQRYIMHAIENYPEWPVSWAQRLLEMVHSSPKQTLNIIYGMDNATYDEKAIRLLLDLYRKSEKRFRDQYIKLLAHLEPEQMEAFSDELQEIFTPENWSLYELLAKGSKEEVIGKYKKIILGAEEKQSFDSSLDFLALKFAKTIVEKKWITIEEIEPVFASYEEAPYFTYEGIYTVYMLGLLKDNRYLPRIAGLFERDEDYLLEMVEKTLIAYQNDEAALAAMPYLLEMDGYAIHSMSLLGTIKTTEAEKGLLKLYQIYKNSFEINHLSRIVESLGFHFTETAVQPIQEYLGSGDDSMFVDSMELGYGFHSVMGIDHPKMEKWKASWTKGEKRTEKAMGQSLLEN